MTLILKMQTSQLLTSAYATTNPLSILLFYHMNSYFYYLDYSNRSVLKTPIIKYPRMCLHRMSPPYFVFYRFAPGTPALMFLIFLPSNSY